MKTLLNCMLFSALSGAFAADCATALVTVDEKASCLWTTVTAAQMPVSLEWPSGATRASVLVDGIEAAVCETAGTPSVNVQFVRPSESKGEKVVTLSVRYLNGGTLLAEKSVKLGLVVGTANDDLVSVRAESSRAFAKCRFESVVLPIPTGTTELTVDGTPLTDFTSAGWCQWCVRSGSHVLCLMADDAVWERMVWGPTGFMLIFR